MQNNFRTRSVETSKIDNKVNGWLVELIIFYTNSFIILYINVKFINIRKTGK